MSDLGVIRQWCETCQEATETWVDRGSDERCATCDPAELDDREDWDGVGWDE